MGTRFISVGKGKDRKAFPLKGSKNNISKRKFTSKSTTTKSRFKVPTLPNDPPRFKTDDELTPEEEKKTLEVLNLLDDSLKDGLDEQGLELQKEIGQDIAETDPSGDTFFQGGKAFKVELDPSLGIIAVDERFQDENNKWKTGRNIFFAQGEGGQEIADEAGGFFVDKIMEFLDSAGSLEDAR